MILREGTGMPGHDGHDPVTRDQLTKQAAPFAAMPAHSDADIVRIICEARLTPTSVVVVSRPGGYPGRVGGVTPAHGGFGR
jgi:hypothetical protein